MPTIDAGHYFLTVLFPVKTEPFDYKPYDGISVRTTPILALRDTLASLPTAHQSEACLPNCNSPFARNTRNHFARFVVIDSLAFNGRVQTETLVAAVRGPNPIIPQKADRLNAPYLFFSADFNLILGDDRDLESYLTTLWETMQDELDAILRLCAGFETVKTATDFIAYVRRCQIETTMPFHDYWSAEELKQLPKVAPALKLGAAIAGILLLAVLLAAVLIHMPILCRIGLALIGLIAAGYGLYLLVMQEGQKPFPAAHGADLPGVLKALYLQKHFTRFAMANQGADPAALHAAFAAFLQTHQPSYVAAPTQAPGVIGA